MDKSELALFISMNPEARDHLDAIKEFAEDFGLKLDTEESLNKAWKRVKPTIAKESESSRDFEIKGKTSKVDVSKLAITDIYAKNDDGSSKYTEEQKKKWRSTNA